MNQFSEMLDTETKIVGLTFATNNVSNPTGLNNS